MVVPKTLRRLRRDPRGAVLVEMAMVLPVLLALLMGILCYGDWFLTAHGLQQAANDGARAAVGGLNATERGTLANGAAMASLGHAGMLDPALATVAVDDDGTTVTVRLAYDASTRPMLRMSFVPLPPLMIRRASSVRIDSL